MITKKHKINHGAIGINYNKLSSNPKLIFRKLNGYRKRLVQTLQNKRKGRNCIISNNYNSIILIPAYSLMLLIVLHNQSKILLLEDSCSLMNNSERN